MATTSSRGANQEVGNKASANEQRLLWNPENVKDVAESVGVQNIGDEALRTLSQDVEYRIGQVLVEALRMMRCARRTTMAVSDISSALRVLDVEPLYGYDSTRPLRYGEASLGPGQPLFYIEDEEIDFEKLINAPLPKVPRDSSLTGHWLAMDGVQPAIPQNPTTSESRSQDLLPKGPGANPALGALAGNDNPGFRPHVKHVLSKELILYFEKVQAALMDDSPDPEAWQLREAALDSVASDPGIHQLVPYFVQFISNQVTHYQDDVFVLKVTMQLTNAMVSNNNLYLAPHASTLCSPALTCLLARRLGSETGSNATKAQYELRQYAAKLIGLIARNYSSNNRLLRPKLARSCLKSFLNPDLPPQVWYGACLGMLETGGPEVIRVLMLPNLKDFENALLAPLREKGEASRTDYEMVMSAIIEALQALSEDSSFMMNGIDGNPSAAEARELKDFVGELIGQRILALGDYSLNRAIVNARAFQ
ncbi:DUF1546-domain-containing protein [Xylariomycetidae sp. FL2044]|nr:DUF1546-domain-containing protein [Xylariomycetidae sp. FL2044]